MSTADVTYHWHEATVPPTLEVAQVYGYLLCPTTGRVLIQEVAPGVFNLPGGSPEPEDQDDMVSTLVREAMEESQVRVDDAAYLGYQEVHENGRAPYAQVRMVGRIAGFEPRHPDPDGGRLFRRFMASIHAAPDVLGWGAPAVAQASLAARLALDLWDIPVGAPAPPGYMD